MTQQSWSLIILSYNEEASIRNVIIDAWNLLCQNGVSSFEIIVVDDGSSDNSVEAVNELAAQNVEVRLVALETNRGIGEALRIGYSSSKYDNVGMIPGDGQFDVSELLPFLEIPEKTVISFVRRQKPGYSLFRNALSFTNRAVMYCLVARDISDINWVKIYKGEALRALQLRLRSSLIESEILAKLLNRGHHIVHVPSKYLPRAGGTSSSASIKNLYRVLRETLALIIAVLSDRAELRGFGRPADRFSRSIGTSAKDG
jgi:glycosyltransferase involved in cell wall biosynthesis